MEPLDVNEPVIAAGVFEDYLISSSLNPDSLNEIKLCFVDLFADQSDEWQNEAWKEIDQAYNRRSRNYHNLAHISQMLFDASHISEDDIDDRLGAAIFYHDFVYEPGASDNEEKSAAKARSVLVDTRLSSVADEVAEAILATKHHISEIPWIQCLINIDLLVLSDPWPYYCTYIASIRHEFAAFSDEQFFEGRIRFLEKMLSREFIYYSVGNIFCDEEAARENMTKELDILRRKDYTLITQAIDEGWCND